MPFPPPEIITALPNHERIDLGALPLRPGRLPDRQRRRQFRPLSRRPNAGCQAATAARIMPPASAPCGSAHSRSASRPRISTAWRGARVRSPFVRGVMASLSGRAMIIGVDRLDYSKGIALRMEAFERFLADHPEWRGNGHLSADHAEQPLRDPGILPRWSAMSPATVGQHQRQLRRAVVDADPLRQQARYSRTALAGLYRASRAALVTPLARRHESGRQGICRRAGSRRSGRADPVALCRRGDGMQAGLAGQSLRSGAVGAAIARALSMPLEERRARQDALYNIILQSDIDLWPDRFLDALKAQKAQPASQQPERIQSRGEPPLRALRTLPFG